MTNYKIDVLNYFQDNQVRSDCSDITFYNIGTTVITLNAALPLQPGQSITFNANNNEIDRTIYSFKFSGAGTNSIIIFRKIYI
jgi:hypothetical protein